MSNAATDTQDARDFDPYHKWLGIPSSDQPPHHYRLLRIELFESDADVIDFAYNKEMEALKREEHGPHVHYVETLSRELIAARTCLLNKQRKSEYDKQLRQHLAQSSPPSVDDRTQVRQQRERESAVERAVSVARSEMAAAHQRELAQEKDKHAASWDEHEARLRRESEQQLAELRAADQRELNQARELAAAQQMQADEQVEDLRRQLDAQRAELQAAHERDISQAVAQVTAELQAAGQQELNRTVQQKQAEWNVERENLKRASKLAAAREKQASEQVDTLRGQLQQQRVDLTSKHEIQLRAAVAEVTSELESSGQAALEQAVDQASRELRAELDEATRAGKLAAARNKQAAEQVEELRQQVENLRQQLDRQRAELTANHQRELSETVAKMTAEFSADGQEAIQRAIEEKRSEISAELEQAVRTSKLAVAREKQALQELENMRRHLDRRQAEMEQTRQHAESLAAEAKEVLAKNTELKAEQQQLWEFAEGSAKREKETKETISVLERRLKEEQRLREAADEIIKSSALISTTGTQDPAILVNSVGIKLAYIPAGEFLMGSPDDEVERDAYEVQHEAQVLRPFYLGVAPVTQQQYRSVTGQNPSFFCSGGAGHEQTAEQATDEFPVEMVSWEDAVRFCEILSALPEERAAGRVYRLPSEVEWEYACRADTATAFAFGSSLSSDQANFNGGIPYGDASRGPYLESTTRVASYSPNAWGIHDMHGNVWEWCQDRYHRNAYRSRVPSTVTARVLRGGCWDGGGRICRSANRFGDLPTMRNSKIGFRVAAFRQQGTQ